MELIGVFIIRTETRLERELGQLLEQDACTQVIEKGLGANDVPGNTHILRVPISDRDEAWWRSLPDKLNRLLRNVGY